MLQCECREKLEVEHGLREFVFSDCATPWLLPLELMPPPPPPRRRTLPLKRGPANATPATSLNVAVRIGLISGKTLVTVDGEVHHSSGRASKERTIKFIEGK